ncbi:FkbM family methyltransferase [Mesorhizobium sp. M0768]|uniref:FkbM family methyltransferase n=1 Tax=Mesorhizobium sp. M0768 TaxID=2956996 RepID=UPI00333655C2
MLKSSFVTLRAMASGLLNAFQFKTIPWTERVILVGRGSMYVSPRDNRGRRILAMAGVTQRSTSRLWRLLATEMAPDIILDIGANYGEIAFCTTYRNATSVHLFEANPYLEQYLRRSIQSRADHRIFHLHMCAASSSRGTVSLTIDKKWSGTSSLVGEIADSAFKGAGEGQFERTEVSSIPVDTVVDGESKAVLFKIDVEGWEINVLSGMSKLLKESKSFAGIVEFDERHLGRAGGSAEELRHSLLRYGKVYLCKDLMPTDNEKLPPHGDFLVLKNFEIDRLRSFV